MAGKIQMKRGTYAAMDLNALYQGEWYYCTDTKAIYMAHGDGTGKEIASSVDMDAVEARATLLEAERGGWIVAEAMTYASADAPTFVVTVAAGAASRYAVGMRVKLTQTTVKYFIITAVSDTTLTLYGGTDYTLTSAAITSPYYSSAKAPVGFPTDPMKWSVVITDTSSRSQLPPTTNTYYNLGSLQITVPIGAWKLSFSVNLTGACTAQTTVGLKVSLSTSASVPNNALLGYTAWSGTNILAQITTPIYRETYVSHAEKQLYYLISAVTAGTCTTLYNLNDAETATLRAVCAYL